MTRNRDSSASLNLWLGTEGSSDTAPVQKTRMQVLTSLPCKHQNSDPFSPIHPHHSMLTGTPVKISC